jgi:hypothetical protein
LRKDKTLKTKFLEFSFIKRIRSWAREKIEINTQGNNDDELKSFVNDVEVDEQVGSECLSRKGGKTLPFLLLHPSLNTKLA